MSDFPRIITLLRKEQGISQKQAALELGVSQALLSHYEKGIRECGLDFVVQIADYYNVSCDYLLGRTADRNGTFVNIAETEEDDGETAETENIPRENTAVSLNRKLVSDSIEIIFGLLEQTNCKGLTSEVSSYLMVSVYKMLRTLYSANPRNPEAMFSVIPDVYAGLSTAVQSITETNAKCLSKGKNIDGLKGTVYAVSLSPEIISVTYPELAPSLYHLVKKTEEKMKKLC